MRFYTKVHEAYCGIDRHARSMDVCTVNHDGELLVHRHMNAAPDPFLKAVAPSRDGLVVAVECRCPWYGLADRCAHERVPFVLGQARSLKALHGGKATHDTIDAHKMAALRRGGLLPQAPVDPAARRAPRDLLRRRSPLRRQRADHLAQVPQTTSQDHLPARGKNSASKATRDGVADRLADPAVHKGLAGDWARITSDDPRLTDLARALGKSATPHDAHTCSRRRSGPGVGQLWALVLRDDLHDRHRCPRGPDFVSSARLVTWAPASAGQRYGTAGKNMGPAALTGAFSEAAVRCRRHHPAGPQFLATGERTHGQGTALTLLAHKPARAVYDRLRRPTVCELEPCLQRSREQSG